ncbi:NADH-quinone oxidoreductase subunit C [Olivibacter sp. XZL3]|uniref:NADH-quinone oxidoreductase subunit C n=1 Tax=Olivibacter sp. XZL3 TaxID=1735116 RepID=UPI001065A42B|nr:NADH-quinone oxidoreductase subunit C [Olivibacter sp. XZL3]
MAKLDNQTLIGHLQKAFGSDISSVEEPFGLLSIQVSKERILSILAFLKDDKELQFIYLTDITAVHYPAQALSIAVVYHLHSLVNNIRIRIKVFLDGAKPEIPSATSLWNGANWMERETYDFFGVIFEGHPDLRRILNVDEMEVFPMRKEYPLEDPNRVDKKDFFFGR